MFDCYICIIKKLIKQIQINDITSIILKINAKFFKLNLEINDSASYIWK